MRRSIEPSNMLFTALCGLIPAVLPCLAAPALAQQIGEQAAPPVISQAAAEPDSSPLRIAPVRLSLEEHGVGKQVPNVRFVDLQGNRHSLHERCKSGWTVVAVTSTSCPLSKKYLPKLRDLAERYSQQGVQVLLVNATAADDVARMKEIQAELGKAARYVFDPEGVLLAAVGGTTTTDTLVLDTEARVRFHGAIDDQYGLGYALDQPRVSYLEPALKSLLSGKEPAVGATTAPGCELLLPKSLLADTEEREETTYYADIARLVNDRCIQCHRDGGVAPFDLESYEAVVAHAPMIRDVVQRGVMPPWFAAPQPGQVTSPWANDPSLSAEEVQQLFSWIDGDMPAGDPKLAPPAVEFPEGWLIGKPDAVYEFERPVAIKATGTMDYRNIQVATDEAEDRWVDAIEIQPGDRSVVHHVIVSIIPPGASRLQAAREEGGYWGAYVPGTSVLEYPQGLAKKLPKGATLNFQMHYTPNGRATQDSTRIGLKFAEQPPEHEVKVYGLAKRRLDIPPGAARHQVEAEKTLDFDATIVSFLPHAHLRGAACRYQLETADGATHVLLDIPHYDFNWQLRYVPREPIAVKKGDTLRYIAWYDNSADNPANPDPTKKVDWGPQTTDEMHLGYVEYYVPDAEPGSGEGRISRLGGLSGARELGARLRETLRRPAEAGRAGGQMFERIDRDGDGQLSLEEIQTFLPGGEGLERLFKRLDSDADGFLSPQEAQRIRQALSS